MDALLRCRGGGRVGQASEKAVDLVGTATKRDESVCLIGSTTVLGLGCL